MSNDESGGRRFDLEECTARFGEDIIRFLKTVPITPLTSPLVSQLVRSAGSVGANYCEADDAVSKREFFQKIGTCKKESRESKHWLRLLAAATDEEKKLKIRSLWHEARELHLIFTAILNRRGKEKGEI